ncbi:MAG: S4 domain-containing protein, partial [Planctomycetota bacterium]|nr:S4 domain-containing protein [Planctomycetota bacterium]
MTGGSIADDGAPEVRREKAPRKSRFDFPRAKRNRDRFVFVVGTLAPGRPRRLDRYLQERFEGYSRTFLQSLIKEGRVLVNGRPTRAAREVAVGDEIVLLLPEGLRSEPEEIPFEVLFEDRYLLAVSKPPGIVVHPARGHLSGTLYNGLLQQVKEVGVAGGVETNNVQVVDKAQVPLFPL